MKNAFLSLPLQTMYIAYLFILGTTHFLHISALMHCFRPDFPWKQAPINECVVLLPRLTFSLERSSDLSTVFNLQAKHRELVLCVLPLTLSMRSLKRSIEGKPVQFIGSIQIPQSIYTGKHRRSWKHPLLYQDPLY